MSRREPVVTKAPEDGAKVFWKSLEDKANPERVAQRAAVEVGAQASDLIKLGKKKKPTDDAIGDATISRRGLFTFAAASTALAACARRPVEKIMPYSKAPEHVLPGVSSYYASVLPARGDAIGVLVESHEGRPTKIDGNPAHPSSFGGTDVWTQASIYDLYDPDRGTTPMKGTRQPSGGFGAHAPASWNDFDAAFAEILRTAGSDGGSRLRILYEPTTSPTLLRLLAEVKTKHPKAGLHVWSAAHDGNVREGARLAFGQVVNVVPAYDQAKVILALDSDFLGTETGSTRASRGYAQGRKLKNGPADSMNRLYVVEPAFTTTGMNADHRLRLPAQDVERYLVTLAKELMLAHKLELGGIGGALKSEPAGIPPKWLSAVAADLAGARAGGIIVVGSRQPARVHALAHALNAALGNAGHTVNYYQPADDKEPEPTASIKQLAADIEKNAVGTLIILGGNPVYDAPADLKILDRIKSVGSSVHVSTHVNETSEVCTWFVPRAHELETWGDARALDGTIAVQQPLIAPLYGGRSDVEIVARVAGQVGAKGHDLVQQTFKASAPAGMNPTTAWNTALKTGVAGPSGRALGPLDARQAEVSAAFLAATKAPGALSPQALEVTFAACPKLLDGRYANNPLLLELPDPVTKVCWDNVAFVSMKTAEDLGVQTGTMVRFQKDGGNAIDIAMFVTPGQADNSIAVHLGWGRQRAGRYGAKHGFDVMPLRTSDALGWTTGVKAKVLDSGEIDATRDRYRKVGMAAGESPMPARIRPDDPFEVDTKKYKVTQTQEHDTMEGRPVAIDATLEQYRKNPQFPQFPDEERKDKNEQGAVIPVRRAGSPDPHTPPLWGEWKEESFFKNQHRWGMVVDLTSCTGCNACVIACQIENNVPAVGKEQVWRGREMYWLRVDRYFVGLDANDPQIVFQPVSCVQCEEAPCENVCPVNATEHSPEGLNDMAYNRCIGTRYCANNCPYKVRRFNFLNYHTSGGWYEDVPETEKMHYNPNVTVRMRGVMEKCTYCVQRIQEAKIKSKRTGKPIKDGDVVTACQSVCAADCVAFGDLDDPTSKVAKWRAKDRNYRLLSELGTRPRTTYLGKIRNPNPAMEKA
ncbi:MAG: 4Fe-4S dicluster domain-containing protein [Labilithrix sp.]|nr:4Fe-4S dicluster domain-containing protein [Labilithrix sp.]MCW5815359.1 4Fe-4S dicluster domain-containing protein [Labilithrix sp.]